MARIKGDKLVPDPTEQETIDSWYSIAVSGRLPLAVAERFFRFAAVWIAFNAIYTFKYPRNAMIRSERDQVKTYASNHSSRHVHLLNSSGTYAAACNYLADYGIVNMRDGNQETITATLPAEEVFSCLYTIRCNFLHGDKNPGVARDRRVIEAATDVLSEMLSDATSRSVS